jgi:TRAP transporter 4TM/12TM fusion protein
MQYMSAQNVGFADDGIEAAQRMKEEEELGLRRVSGWSAWLVPAIALIWSLFQLSLSSWLLLDSTIIRAMHLAFALLIVFLSYPTLKRDVRVPGLRWLSEKRRIPVADFLIAILAALVALYIALDYEGIANRIGRPVLRDLVVGTLLVVLLLDAARRVIGPTLPILALVATAYVFLGPYMPDFLAFKGVSLTRYLGQISLTTEGIYGIPLDVSARIVFLFVLFGALLEKAGAGKFFIDLAMSLLGRYRGGPAKAAVLSSGFTGLVSGSSIANVVTTGTFTIPLMKKVGYPPTKAAAIEVASSSNGQLMPPVMGAAAFIIAEYVNITYLEVCKAAIVPAFATYFALFYLTHIEACKLGMKGLPKADLPRFLWTLRNGFHYLVPIAVLLYELIIPRHSADMAAFRAVMVLLLIMLVQGVGRALQQQRPMVEGLLQGGSDILNGLISGARNMVSVAVATASAGIIVGVVTLGLGGMITSIIDTLSMGNFVLMLFITAFACLILGMGLPTTANYRSGHRDDRRMAGGRRAADCRPPVRLLFRHTCGHYATGWLGGLCRSGHCQDESNQDRAAGLHVRHPHGNPALHVHLQHPHAAHRCRQPVAGTLYLCHDLCRHVRLCGRYPALVHHPDPLV